MKNGIINKTVICPGCECRFTIDQLKKHLRKAHEFQEPFSLSEAVFALSGGRITATDLYSENSSKTLITKPQPNNLMQSGQSAFLASDNSKNENRSASNNHQIRARKSKRPKKARTRQFSQPNNDRFNSQKIRQAKKAKSKKRNFIVCILCGEKIPRGKMLEHRQEVHGENRLNTKPKRCYRKSSQWVQIVSGGLPSLGKRNR